MLSISSLGLDLLVSFFGELAHGSVVVGMLDCSTATVKMDRGGRNCSEEKCGGGVSGRGSRARDASLLYENLEWASCLICLDYICNFT